MQKQALSNAQIGWGLTGAAGGGLAGYYLAKLLHAEPTKTHKLLYTLGGIALGGFGGYHIGSAVNEYRDAKLNPDDMPPITGAEIEGYLAAKKSGKTIDPKLRDRIDARYQLLKSKGYKDNEIFTLGNTSAMAGGLALAGVTETAYQFLRMRHSDLTANSKWKWFPGAPGTFRNAVQNKMPGVTTSKGLLDRAFDFFTGNKTHGTINPIQVGGVADQDLITLGKNVANELGPNKAPYHQINSAVYNLEQAHKTGNSAATAEARVKLTNTLNSATGNSSKQTALRNSLRVIGHGGSAVLVLAGAIDAIRKGLQEVPNLTPAETEEYNMLRDAGFK